LVEHLRPNQAPDLQPLIRVVFTYLENYIPTYLKLPGVSVRVDRRIHNGGTISDMAILVLDVEGRYDVQIDYAVDLFDRTTVARFTAGMETLLENLVAAGADARLSQLDALSAAERHQLLVEWRLRRSEFPRRRSIHELFAEQAEKTPAATAVTCGADALTYAELNRRANRLARHLGRLGVGPESLVGLAMERSLAMVVGLAGILKAGGAYLPLDPAYPEERLRFILEDTGATVVLVHAPTRHALERIADSRTLVDLDEDHGNSRADNPPPRTTPDNLAYAIYTSGSTGQPKGVAVTHRSVVRLVRETDFAHLDAEQVFLQFAPVAFDASTLEIWGPLL
ncbi:MAG: AMP-binding protein, partial [bacterium]|nr:AMP-binding protein [bacterium]